MTAQLTPNQRAFLRWADRVSGHFANKPYEGATAASLVKRGLIKGKANSFGMRSAYHLTDAGRAVLAKIDGDQT